MFERAKADNEKSRPGSLYMKGWADGDMIGKVVVGVARNGRLCLSGIMLQWLSVVPASFTFVHQPTLLMLAPFICNVATHADVACDMQIDDDNGKMMSAIMRMVSGVGSLCRLHSYASDP